MNSKYNSKQTIETIIAVSAKLFIEKGYDKTSMQDIVAALGMSKGAIFHHFHSKEDIFHAVMERQLEQMTETFHQWLADMYGLTAREKLRGIINRNLAALTDDTPMKESSTMVAGASGSPHVILAFIQGAFKLAPLIANLLREGREDKSILTDFPDECAEVVVLLLNFWCDTDVFQGDLSVLRKRFRYLQYLLRQVGVDVLDDEMIASIGNYYEQKPM